MPVNLDKPQQWKADIIQSVDMYNDWEMRFGSEADQTMEWAALIQEELESYGTAVNSMAGEKWKELVV